MKFLNKKGDTIVEVMLAVVVLGAALGGAFAISNSASQRTYNNHERYQALQYASQQIDLIRLNAKSLPGLFTDPDVEYPYSDIDGSGCFYISGTQPVYDTIGENCKKEDLYIIKTTANSDNKNFKIEVTWDSLGGGDSRVELVYAIE